MGSASRRSSATTSCLHHRLPVQRGSYKTSGKASRWTLRGQRRLLSLGVKRLRGDFNVREVHSTFNDGSSTLSLVEGQC